MIVQVLLVHGDFEIIHMVQLHLVDFDSNDIMVLLGITNVIKDLYGLNKFITT